MRNFLCFLVLMIFGISVHGQRLISYRLEKSMTTLDIIGVFGIGVPYGADLYKVFYNTPNLEGVDHRASGLVIVPTSDEALRFPIACYQHGTVGSRADVPSTINGESNLALILAGNGYVTVAPDYVGLGVSEGLHPYVHADTEASAGVDLILATREMAEEIENFRINDQLFITGYSQGGHAAMALHREIETNYQGELTVTAAAPMSGPYSISEKMIEFTLGDMPYNTVAYLAWTALSYKAAYPDLMADYNIENMFLPEYVDDIRAFEREEITLWELNVKMINTLLNTVGTVTPKDIIYPELLDALFNDPTHPFRQASAQNDVYDWTVEAPTRLYYCVGDDQVTYENAILAEQVMVDNGSADVQAVRSDTDNNLLDHGGCANVAPLAALFFFNSFKNIMTATGDIVANSDIAITHYDNVLSIDIGEEGFTRGELIINNMAGQVNMQVPITQKKSEIDISQLPSGIYIVTITGNDRLYKASKLVK